MKRVLSAVAVLAIVGTTLAFKASPTSQVALFRLNPATGICDIFEKNVNPGSQITEQNKRLSTAGACTTVSYNNQP